MSFYPEQRLILKNSQLTRNITLPPGTWDGLRVNVGDWVTPTTILAAGSKAGEYRVYNIPAALGVRPDKLDLNEIIPFLPGEMIEAGEPLAKYPKRKRRVPKAPDRAQVVLIEDGRVMLQLHPEELEVRAEVEGEITAIENGVVTIRSSATIMQCAWGNGGFTAALFAFEPGFEYGNPDSPQGGLLKLRGQNVTLSRYRGKVVILLRPLTARDLEIVADQEMMGIVAPSAPVDLREIAIKHTFPVILTEGFGNLQPTVALYDMLYERSNSAAVFNARVPDARTYTRPEIVISSGRGSQDRRTADIESPLRVGMRVRARRAPYAGRIGEVVALPETPVTLENGLRVLCAQVRFSSGERVMIPLANVESLGEAPV